MWSIDPDTGERGWTVELEDVSGTPVVGDDGTLYLEYESNRVIALDGDDGSELWTSDPASADFDTRLTLGANGTIFIGTETSQGVSHLYAFDTNDQGAIRWSFEVEGEMTDPVVDDENTVYFGAGTSSFTEPDEYALYALDGDGDGQEEAWTFDGGGEIGDAALPGADGIVYVKQDDEIYALDRETGDEQWGETVSDGFSSSSDMVLGEDGTIYLTVGGQFSGHALLAIDGDNGEEAWRFVVPETTLAMFTPAVADDGTIFIGGLGGLLYAVEPDEGNELWGLDLSVDHLTTLLSEDGTLYTGGARGNTAATLYALEPEGIEGPADSRWPMSRQGPQQKGSLP